MMTGRVGYSWVFTLNYVYVPNNVPFQKSGQHNFLFIHGKVLSNAVSGDRKNQSVTIMIVKCSMSEMALAAIKQKSIYIDIIFKKMC